MKPTLIVFSESTYSMKCAAAAVDVDADLRILEANLRLDEIVRALERTLPWGRVPALLVGGEDVIVESANIVEWLAIAARRTADLYGLEHRARRVRYAERVADLYVSAPLGRIFHQREGWEPHNEALVEAAATQVRRAVEWLDCELARAEYVVDGNVSAADYAWASALAMAQRESWWAAPPRVAAYLERCAARRWGAYAGLTAMSRPVFESWTPTTLGTE